MGSPHAGNIQGYPSCQVAKREKMSTSPARTLPASSVDERYRRQVGKRGNPLEGIVGFRTQRMDPLCHLNESDVSRRVGHHPSLIDNSRVTRGIDPEWGGAPIEAQKKRRHRTKQEHVDAWPSKGSPGFVSGLILRHVATMRVRGLGASSSGNPETSRPCARRA